MPTPQELEHKMWKAIRSDRIVMLGLDGVEDGHSRPMTAMIEGDAGGPVWFFTSNDNALVQQLHRGHRAIAAFSSKGHDVFASIRGSLSVDNDPHVIDRLWNPFIAAWYEGGRGDPKLVLLRLDAEHAEIWLNESSLFAGVKLLFGADPKQDYEGNVADVSLA